MDPNPYESPKVPPVQPVAPAVRYRPHWGFFTFWLCIAAGPVFFSYLAYLEYCRVGFQGGDGLSATIKWGIIFTMFPFNFATALWFAWRALHWYPSKAD